MDGTLHIDVVLKPVLGDVQRLEDAASVVLVEPIVAAPAATLLLDDVDSVEIVRHGTLPDLELLLAGSGASEGVTSITGADAVRALDVLTAAGAGRVVLACHLNLRVVAARLAGVVEAASASEPHVVIACASATDASGFDALSVDAVHCAGVLVRLLLEEVSCRCELTDSAGIAVTVAGAYGDAMAAMQTSARWSALHRSGAGIAMLSIAVQRDLSPAVPCCDAPASGNGAYRVHAWRPEPVSA